MTDPKFDLREFVRTDGGDLRNQIMRIVDRRGARDAEDIAQEVVLRMLSKAELIVDAEHARSFAIQCALWLTKDDARRRHRSVPLQVRHDPPTDEDVSRWAESGEFLALVRDVVPAAQYVVWEAIEVHGHSRREVAARLGMSEAAVRQKLSRAWTALRAQARRFQSLVAGVGVIPMRRLGPWTRAEVTSYSAVVGAFAGLSLMVGGPHGVGAASLPGSDARSAPSATTAWQPPGAPSRLLPVLPRDTDRSRPGRVAPTVDESAGVPSRPDAPKVNGCIGGLCHGVRHDGQRRYGHGVWANAPVYPAEWWQENVPACDVVDLVPRNSLVGCTRYGSAGEPLTEPVARVP